MTAPPRHLLLLGGGHAQLAVLHELARAPLEGVRASLVTPYPRQMYSGMVPGLVAGHYRAEQCAIALEPLARAAGVEFVIGSAVGLDAASRRVRLADGRELDYEWLSIDTGSVIDRDRIPGAREHALFVRPIETFVTLIDRLADLASRRVLDVVVIGAGAAGVELAMALQHRLAGRGDERARVALVTGGAPPLFGYPQTVIDRARRALARRRITVIPDECARIEEGALVLAGGTRVACDAPVMATGSDAPPWLAASTLALCARGFVSTGATLQSSSHAEVFAAGDVATRSDVEHPRSGVHAVRAGPVLAANLRAMVEGRPLALHRPQPRSLNLVSCGSRSAIASRGGWSAEGRWVWWWKDWIDRRFVARHSRVEARSG